MPSKVIKELTDFEDKYYHLVWYARHSPQNCQGDQCPCKKVETDYPKETSDLSSPDLGDWTHGFNSGMLACTRHIRAFAGRSKMEREYAQEHFPQLDS